jgi:phosphoribosylaminoimidazolecarboxamide formyltransferase/IMP cyclohydrolase
MKNPEPIIRRALISVSDKRELVPFAKYLYADRGVHIISTGGSARTMREAGIVVTEVSEYTGHPECFDGRVKTLHPKVHGGLLFVRGNPEHEEESRRHGIQPIDLVVVNLYPFSQTIAKLDVSEEEAIENIDIGGPSMLRSAAKNFDSVAVVCDPSEYGKLRGHMDLRSGATTREYRRQLAGKVFLHTGKYDMTIAAYMNA